MSRAGIALLAAAVVGCAANMTLPRPTDPGVIAVRVSPGAPVNAVVQVDDFSLGAIKTNFTAADMQQFRRDIPIKIGNDIFAALAGGQQFRTVKRTSAGPQADYIVSGVYDHTSYFGARGRDWIPMAGIVGAHINEATVTEVLHVSVTETATGREVLSTSVRSDQDEWTSIYQGVAQSTWLEPRLIGQAAQAAYEAIRNAAAGSYPSPNAVAQQPASSPAPTAPAPVNAPSPATPLIVGINARVARIQFFVDESLDDGRKTGIETICSRAKPQSSFVSSSTTFIWFCMFVVPEGKFTEGSVSFAIALKREKDGSLVTWFPAVTMNPKPEWPYGMLFQGYGSKEAGEIPAGVYRLEVYAHNELVGQGRFSVR